VLRSPFDGDVVSREVEPGTTVNPGAPVLKLADPRTAWVTVHVDERETGQIAPGDQGEIRLRSQPGRTFRGRVVRVRRESDRVTEQLAVDVTFEARPARLTLGEQAEATIRPAPRRAAVALPLAALVRTSDGPATLVVVDGWLRLRPLRLGLVDPAGWAEVLDGLRGGEPVVLAPGPLADPGAEGRRVLVRVDETGTAGAESRP
jgi:HlyD family secretion protein